MELSFKKLLLLVNQEDQFMLIVSKEI